MGDEYEAGNVNLRRKTIGMTLEKIKEMNLKPGDPIETTVKTADRFGTTIHNYPGYFAYAIDKTFAYAGQSDDGFLSDIKLKKISEIEKIIRFERKVEEGDKK